MELLVHLGEAKRVSFRFSDWDSTRSISVLELTGDRDATVIGAGEFRQSSCGLCRILAGRPRRHRNHLLSAITSFHLDPQYLLRFRIVIVLQSLNGCGCKMQRTISRYCRLTLSMYLVKSSEDKILVPRCRVITHVQKTFSCYCNLASGPR